MSELDRRDRKLLEFLKEQGGEASVELIHRRFSAAYPKLSRCAMKGYTETIIRLTKKGRLRLQEVQS